MLLDLSRKEIEFENIHGYDDIKDIVKRAIDAEDNYNLLFIGPPANAKTLFLLRIIECKKGVYFVASAAGVSQVNAAMPFVEPILKGINELFDASDAILEIGRTDTLDTPKT